MYQVNCTYYSALGDDDDKYLIARAVQFFAPGTPMVYYVGLLAGHNDLELLERTKEGRNINRHYYTETEIERDLQRPVVQKLLTLMELCNTHPSFDGTLRISHTAAQALILRWEHGKAYAELSVDFMYARATIHHSDGTQVCKMNVKAE